MVSSKSVSPRALRFPDETDDDFRARVERVARIARVLIEAALANGCVRDFIEDPALPYSIESVSRSPDVRVEYAEAIAIGDIFNCLRATRSKHWGDGPFILPLQPDDPVDPARLLYLYRPRSCHHRRFQQRRRLKELLGRRYRRLVVQAQRRTRAAFLASIADEEVRALGRILNVSPVHFWRAVKGKEFLELPPNLVQLEFDFAG